MSAEKTEEELKKTAGDNLRMYRTIKHYTQRDMGDILGCSSAVYSSYESGRRTLQYPMLYKFWQKGGNLNWLITNTGEMMREKEKSDFTIHRKAAEEAQQYQADLLYASARKPEKEALVHAYNQVYNNLLNFYSDSEQYDRFEMIEKHNLALKPLRDLF